MLLGRRPLDYDLATSARPEEVSRIFEGRRVKSFGRSFGVVQVDGYEVATYSRAVTYSLVDRRGEATLAETIQEDLGRRDLTINALAWDPLSGELVDPWGGVEDARRGIVRLVGEGGDRLREDPVRILRACRFLAILEGCFGARTSAALHDSVGLLDHVAPERIRGELLKAMDLVRPSSFFIALAGLNGLGLILPSLAGTIGVGGGPYHAETVFIHSLLTGDAVSRRCPFQRLAAFLHDVGKPGSRKIAETGQVGFHKHEHLGMKLVRRDLAALRFSRREISLIGSLVRLHMRLARPPGPKAIRRILAALQGTGLDYRALIRQNLADRRANLKVAQPPVSEVKGLLNLFEDELVRQNSTAAGANLAINGRDVMAELGLASGPEVGRMLKKLIGLTIENPELNTRAKLLRAARRLSPEKSSECHHSVKKL